MGKEEEAGTVYTNYVKVVIVGKNKDLQKAMETIKGKEEKETKSLDYINIIGLGWVSYLLKIPGKDVGGEKDSTYNVLVNVWLIDKNKIPGKGTFETFERGAKVYIELDRVKIEEIKEVINKGVKSYLEKLIKKVGEGEYTKVAEI